MAERDETLEKMIAADRAFFSKPKKERVAILAEMEKDPRWKSDPLLKQYKMESDWQGEGKDPDYID